MIVKEIFTGLESSSPFVYALCDLELIFLCFHTVIVIFTSSWLNTTMTENRKVLTNNDLDGFDKVYLLLLCNFIST